MGSSQGAATDLNGNFQISNLEAGTYDVRLSIIGYQPMVYKGVVIRSDLRTRISIELAPGASYHASAHGTGGADLVVDYGVAEGDENVGLDDGVVTSYSLKQEAQLARLSVERSQEERTNG